MHARCAAGAAVGWAQGLQLVALLDMMRALSFALLATSVALAAAGVNGKDLDHDTQKKVHGSWGRLKKCVRCDGTASIRLPSPSAKHKRIFAADEIYINQVHSS